ncbi:hypothetical protein COLO4_32741 [Corchorus olitorius]|uniref:Uncharacterized protein n=1 Tax=Corchorus olitorius TaxID=93759 RepID=A0A1R3GYE9_9ROSI|nr:hypothetical protein COLO4_32741 [Corchorus olitorius]
MALAKVEPKTASFLYGLLKLYKAWWAGIKGY